MTTTLASRIGGVCLLGTLLAAATPGFAQFLVAHGPNLRAARTLEILTVVVDDSNSLWAPDAKPDGKRLLQVLAKADMRIADVPGEITLDPAPVAGNVQMGIDVDGAVFTMNLPLPAPDGSRPYRFYVSPQRDNERGIPIYTLSAQDAKPLGPILKALELQKPAR